MTRSVVYISGSRADFGLMRRTLAICRDSQELDVSVIATGQHLLAAYGRTLQDIESADFRVAGTVSAQLTGNSGAEMACAIGDEVIGITRILEVERPDIVLLLGDRGEMLAGAIVALHIGIPSVHIHGGELSGSVDEPVRHAISKLSHLHLAATESAKKRLLQLGEEARRIHVVGAPGLDDVFQHTPASRQEIAASAAFDPDSRIAVLLYHPVVQALGEGGRVMELLLEALLEENFQTVVLLPNSDAGGAEILDAWVRFYSRLPNDKRNRFHESSHISRDRYLDWVAACDVIIGNSSSGIIESATLGTPCINVGSRQLGRERNSNTLDVREPTTKDVRGLLNRARKMKKGPWPNIYGDGQASQRIFHFLAEVKLTTDLLRKQNTY